MPSRTAPQLARIKTKRTTESYLIGSAPETFAMLEQQIGGRGALVSALLHAPADEGLSQLIGQIADPRNDVRKLAQVCADLGVTTGQLLEAYEAGVMAKARVASIKTLAEGLPAVMEDAVTRAAPHFVDCASCRGTKMIWEPARRAGDPPVQVVCTACVGTGQLLMYPDLDRQKFVAGLAGLTPKQSPLATVDLSDRRSLSINPANPIASMATLVQTVDRLLYNRRGSPAAGSPESAETDADPIDADVVETPFDARSSAPSPAARDESNGRSARVLHRPSAPVGPLPPPGRRRGQ